MARESTKSEGCAFDSFVQIVHGLGGSVGDAGPVPVDDLGVPSAQAARFWRAVGIGEIAGN